MLIRIIVELDLRPFIHCHYFCRQAINLHLLATPRAPEPHAQTYDLLVNVLHLDIQCGLWATEFPRVRPPAVDI